MILVPINYEANFVSGKLSLSCNFHSRTLHLDIIRDFYLPTDAQENCFKNNIKMYIKTAPTSFGVTFKRRIKSRLPFAGIIRSSPYSTRFQDKG